MTSEASTIATSKPAIHGAIDGISMNAVDDLERSVASIGADGVVGRGNPNGCTLNTPSTI